MKSSHPKIYYSLLAISYLEVIFWTSCLLSSAGSANCLTEDTSYLQRETWNLKQSVGALEASQQLLAPVELRGWDLHTQLEWLAFQRLKESLSGPCTPALVQQRPQLSLQLLPVLKGVPAPYTGIKAFA
jgi:hypothetical protein